MDVDNEMIEESNKNDEETKENGTEVISYSQVHTNKTMILVVQKIDPNDVAADVMKVLRKLAAFWDEEGLIIDMID